MHPAISVKDSVHLHLNIMRLGFNLAVDLIRVENIHARNCNNVVIKKAKRQI